jgi:hypothetical protein
MSRIQLLSKPKTLRGPTYLFPCVCFGCRKTFRKPPSDAELSCPACAKPMVMLSRKFSSPKQRDAKQWQKVQQLVEHGFYFFSVYRTAANGKKISVPYPKNLSEVPAFAQEFSDQSTHHRPHSREK